MALQACKHVGGPSKRPWFQSYVSLSSSLLRRGLNISPCSSHSQYSVRASSSVSSGTVSNALVLRTFALRLGRALPYLSVVFASSPCRKVVLSRVQFLRSASGTRSARTHVPLLSVQHDPLLRHLAPQAPRCYRCPGSHEARRETKVRSSFRSNEFGPVGSSTCRVAKKTPSRTTFAGSTIGGKITSL